jgi:hypothetical protein
LPIGGCLIIGHNFDSEAGFQRAINHAGENLKSATWRNLLAFLKQVEISPELQSKWSGVTRIRTLDEQGEALVYPSTFSGVLLPAAVVALTHPAYRNLNVKSRRYGDLQGDTAEQALVRDALARAGKGETKESMGSFSFSLSDRYPKEFFP